MNPGSIRIIALTVRAFVRAKPFVEARSPHEATATECDRRQRRRALHLAVDQVVNMGFRAAELTRDFARCQDFNKPSSPVIEFLQQLIPHMTLLRRS
jgi:hypothetical protein